MYIYYYIQSLLLDNDLNHISVKLIILNNPHINTEIALDSSQQPIGSTDMWIEVRSLLSWTPAIAAAREMKLDWLMWRAEVTHFWQRFPHAEVVNLDIIGVRNLHGCAHRNDDISLPLRAKKNRNLSKHVEMFGKWTAHASSKISIL